MTHKAILILKQADLVLYDFLCHPNLLHHCPASCETICVGKRRGQHSHTQDDIHALILKHSKNKKHIIRLKGGSPGIFGRLAEELHFLTTHHIPYQIIPGISTGTAAAELAGIPLTDRQFAHSVAFLTGSLQNDTQQKQIPIADTLVIFMGIKHLSALVNRILENSHYPAKTPAIIIYKSSLADERQVTTTLDRLAQTQKEEKISHPSLIIISKTVPLHKKFTWKHTQALHNTHIILLKRYEQCQILYEQLALAGASISIQPSFKITPLSKNLIQITAETLKQYTHLIFTSTNTVSYFFKALLNNHADTRSLAHCQIISIGESTNTALKTHGILPNITAEAPNSEGLIRTLKNKVTSLKTAKILLPAAEKTRGLLEKELHTKCQTFTKLALYKTTQIKPHLQDFPANSWILISAKSMLENVRTLNQQQENITQTLNLLTIGTHSSQHANQHKKLFKQHIILPNTYKHEILAATIIKTLKKHIKNANK